MYIFMIYDLLYSFRIFFLYIIIIVLSLGKVISIIDSKKGMYRVFYLEVLNWRIFEDWNRIVRRQGNDGG